MNWEKKPQPLYLSHEAIAAPLVVLNPSPWAYITGQFDHRSMPLFGYGGAWGREGAACPFGKLMCATEYARGSFDPGIYHCAACPGEVLARNLLLSSLPWERVVEQLALWLAGEPLAPEPAVEQLALEPAVEQLALRLALSRLL